MSNTVEEMLNRILGQNEALNIQMTSMREDLVQLGARVESLELGQRSGVAPTQVPSGRGQDPAISSQNRGRAARTSTQPPDGGRASSFVSSMSEHHDDPEAPDRRRRDPQRRSSSRERWCH